MFFAHRAIICSLAIPTAAQCYLSHNDADLPFQKLNQHGEYSFSPPQLSFPSKPGHKLSRGLGSKTRGNSSVAEVNRFFWSRQTILAH